MEEEISLREIIEVILNGKWIIAIITAIAVGIAGFFSFYIQDPIYEAESTLMVKAQDAQDIENEDALSALVGSLSEYPVLSMATYTEQVKNPAIMQRVIEQLELQEKYSVNGLQNALKVQAVEKTNLIKLKLTGKNPEEVQKIVNAVADEFIALISEQSQQQMGRSAQILKVKMENAKAEYDQAIEELKTFEKQSPSVAELSGELKARLETVTTYKTRLDEIQIELETLQSALAEAKQELSGTPKILETNQSLASNPFMHSVVEEQTGTKSSDTASLEMKSESINPVYTSLQQRITSYNIQISELKSEKASTQKDLESNQKRLEQLRVQHTEKKSEYDSLLNKVNKLNSTYDLFYQKYEEARITSTSELGSNNVTMISPAFTPESPVGPNKVLNVAIAFVVGLMISVFIVFFMSYWRNSKVGTNVVVGHDERLNA